MGKTLSVSLLVGLGLGVLTVPRASVDWNNAASCRECHEDIYKEWETTRNQLQLFFRKSRDSGSCFLL